MQRGIRDDLREIFGAAVEAVDPARLVSGAIARRGDRVEVRPPDGSAPAVLKGAVGVFGAGKAAARMAAAFEEGCERCLDVSGTVVAPVGTDLPDLKKIRVLPGEHPVPGPLGLAGTERMVEEIEATAGAVDHFVCLLSGGGSSLLVSPIPPLVLGEKQQVTQLLLNSGAAIDEINQVRKHLSRVKGGRILRLVGGRPVLSMIVSDVVGDDPATIGSGPAVPDRSTFADAIGVLRKYKIYEDCPKTAREVLERGVRGEIEETVRPGTAEANLATPIVLGSNSTALGAAAEAAGRLGYRVEVEGRPLVGDTASAALGWFSGVGQHCRGSRPVCCLAGGETTVRVRGGGKGGRNQEFALALVEAAGGMPVSVLSAGTDGVDGPTRAAGAFVDGTTRGRSAERRMSPSAYLQTNDSFSFFNELGDLFTTGPTGTNVMDLKIALFRPASSA